MCIRRGNFERVAGVSVHIVGLRIDERIPHCSKVCAGFASSAVNVPVAWMPHLQQSGSSTFWLALRRMPRILTSSPAPTLRAT